MKENGESAYIDKFYKAPLDILKITVYLFFTLKYAGRIPQTVNFQIDNYSHFNKLLSSTLYNFQNY